MVMDQLKIKLYILVCLLALCIPCQAVQLPQAGDHFDEKVYYEALGNGLVPNTGAFGAPGPMTPASYYRDMSDPQRYESENMKLNLNNRPVMTGNRNPSFRFTKPNKASIDPNVYNGPQFDEIRYKGQGPPGVYFKDISDYIRYVNEQMMHMRPIINNKYPDRFVTGPMYPKTAAFMPPYSNRHLSQQYANALHSTRNNDFQDLTSYRNVKDNYLPYENFNELPREYYANDFDDRSQFAKIGYKKRFGIQ